MSTSALGYLPFVGPLLHTALGPAGPVVNAAYLAYTGANFAALSQDLFTLTATAPTPIVNLKESLISLSQALEEGNFHTIKELSSGLEQQIEALTEKPSKDNFKGYGWFSMQSWDTYLKPLTDLKNELKAFRQSSLSGYDTSKLETHLGTSLEFMIREMQAHDGLGTKVLRSGARALKNVTSQEFPSLMGRSSEGEAPSLKLTPLAKIIGDLTQFRLNSGKKYLHEYKEQVLKDDLRALEKSSPYFKGIFDFVVNNLDGQPLVDKIDGLIFNFIVTQKILDNVDMGALQFGAYYAALNGGALDSEKQTEDVGTILKVGSEQFEKALKECDKDPKARALLFSALAIAIEMEHGREIKDHALPPGKPHEITIQEKVNGLYELIQKHPMILLYPRYREEIQTIINSCLKTLSQAKKGSILDLNQAHGANQEENLPGALRIIKGVLEKSQGSKPKASVLGQTMTDLASQARQLGVPASFVDPVENLAKEVTQKVEGIFDHGGKEERLSPFAKLESDLNLSRASQKRRHPATVDRELLNDLRGIEAAYPELGGLVRFVQKTKGDRPLIACVDDLVNQFLLSRIETRSSLQKIVNNYSEQFYQSLYHATDKTTSQERSTPQAQATEGEKIWTSRKCSPAALMHAVEKVFEVDSLVKVAKELETTPSDTAAELSRKIDTALGVLATHPPSEELSGALEIVYFQVQSYIDLAARLAGRKDHERINQAQALAQSGNFVGALKALKEIFDNGTLLLETGQPENLDPKISAVGQLAVDFEQGKKVEKGTLTPAKQKELIALEERKLAHNLSLFATFKVLAKRKGLSERVANGMFEEIIKKVDEIDYDGSLDHYANKGQREELFKEELNKKMDAGIFDRLIHHIVFSLVKHFTSQFSKSLVQGAQTALVDPLQRPTKGHHGAMRAANNGILGLLFAERIWRRDDTGQLGVGEKDDRLLEILQGMNHDGKKGNDLVSEVVNKALEDFDAGTYCRIGIFNQIATFFVRKMAQLIVNRMDLANSVMETVSNSIYSERHPNYSLDALLLHQIKELEKILGEEGAELVIREGDNGKRLAQQLMDNLFKLLGERGVLSPEEIANKKDSLMSRLQEGTDTIVKGVLRDLLLFGIEQFQKPEKMNQTVLEVLKHANRALRPSEATLLRELFSDISDTVPVHDLITLFEVQYSDLKTSEQGEITRQECEAALARKYKKIEQELHEAMDRIITKAIGGALETQVENLLKTPRQALLESVQWVHEQFTPYRAHLADKTAYIDEMESLLIEQATGKNTKSSDQLTGKIKERHQKFLIQLQKQLKLLKSLKTEGPSPINRQINQLHYAINQIQRELNELNVALIGNETDKALAAIHAIRDKMITVRGALDGIEASLSYEELSLAEKGKEAALSGVKQGAEGVKPYVRAFLNHHIQGHAQEAVSLYKARSTFAAIMQQGVFRSYLEYQPSHDEVDPHEAIAEDHERKFERECVKVEGPTEKKNETFKQPDGLYLQPLSNSFGY